MMLVNGHISFERAGADRRRSGRALERGRPGVRSSRLFSTRLRGEDNRRTKLAWLAILLFALNLCVKMHSAPWTEVHLLADGKGGSVVDDNGSHGLPASRTPQTKVCVEHGAEAHCEAQNGEEDSPWVLLSQRGCDHEQGNPRPHDAKYVSLLARDSCSYCLIHIYGQRCPSASRLPPRQPSRLKGIVRCLVFLLNTYPGESVFDHVKEAFHQDESIHE